MRSRNEQPAPLACGTPCVTPGAQQPQAPDLLPGFVGVGSL